jgi:hypothetical protein
MYYEFNKKIKHLNISFNCTQNVEHSILDSINSNHSSPTGRAEHTHIRDHLSNPLLLLANNLGASRRRVSVSSAKKYKLRHFVNTPHKSHGEMCFQQTPIYLPDTKTGHFTLSTQNMSGAVIAQLVIVTMVRFRWFGVPFLSHVTDFCSMHNIHYSSGAHPTP